MIELKTEIHDLGQIERSLGWYEREAWRAARRLGWRPISVMGWLILLATEANDARVLANRAAILAGFPQRSRHLTEILAGTLRSHGASSQVPTGALYVPASVSQLPVSTPHALTSASQGALSARRIATSTARSDVGRGVAMVDPRSRRRAWVRPLVVDGRPTRSPYRDYADFMRASTRRSGSGFPSGATKRARAR